MQVRQAGLRIHSRIMNKHRVTREIYGMLEDLCRPGTSVKGVKDPSRPTSNNGVVCTPGTADTRAAGTLPSRITSHQREQGISIAALIAA
jgi:hypothetical protein